MAIACAPSREAALGFPSHKHPVTQIRLLLQPCTHTLLQRQVLAAAAYTPTGGMAPVMPLGGCSADASADEPSPRLNSYGENAIDIRGRADASSSCRRLFICVAELLRELLASPFAHHLLELCQFSLLMRCISTYLKAAKLKRLQLRPHKVHLQTSLYPSASADVRVVSGIPSSAIEGICDKVRESAAAALKNSSEGVALQWLLQLLQRKAPQLFVATLVFCMRKTEPLVSPAVLESLLQEQLPPADPVTLFCSCLEIGLLHTAALYLLPIQIAEGPLQVLLSFSHLVPFAVVSPGMGWV